MHVRHMRNAEIPIVDTSATYWAGMRFAQKAQWTHETIRGSLRKAPS